MTELAAVLTMVRNDHFFLRRWVDYYGRMFGREALYVLNHGGSEEVAEIASGCSVVRIPPGRDENFNTKRAHILSSFASGLLKFYHYVIVVDVDEFVVLDPKTGVGLPEWLSRRRRDVVLTPIGLEVVHLPEVESEPIGERILQVRRHARYSSFYCKPCILGCPAKLSRGGHYSSYTSLRMFKPLYLFHMKYCDRDQSLATMKDRGALMQEVLAEAGPSAEPLLPTRWDKDIGAEEEKLEFLQSFPVVEGFDFSERMEAMERSWGHRQHDLYHFERHVEEALHVVPKRFASLI